MAAPDVKSVGAPRRVLVVDDQPDVRRMLQRMLRGGGYDTTESSSGQHAIELAGQCVFDLVVSDVQMPDMDGVELLRALHEVDGDLPVLLLSGAPDLDTAMKAIEFGAVEYLTKPIKLDKFLSSVTRAIDLGRKRREEQDALRRFRSGERVRMPEGTTYAGEVCPGALLGGRYRVGKLIGHGGMGAVYEAMREDLAHMPIALKVLHRSVEGDSEYLARFRREAETVAAINHPNIVRILDFHSRDGEPAFLVMELLDGASLEQVIDRAGPLTQRRAAFVVSQVLAALAAAHRANVIHRDLKPANVFLTSMSGLKDIVKLLDFGVAKILDSAGAQKLTQTGAVVGTPAYMAPEQARGATIDARTDIYSVGCVLYEALTGRTPFHANNYNALLYAIQQSEPLPFGEVQPEVDPKLVEVVMKAMAKDPDARFQSAEAMIGALSLWASSIPSLPPPPPGTYPMAFAPTVAPPRDPPPAGASAVHDAKR